MCWWIQKLTGICASCSSNLNQGRKKQKGRKSFASKVCLEQNLDAMPVESEVDIYSVIIYLTHWQ
jgi:hypothetical protein